MFTFPISLTAARSSFFVPHVLFTPLVRAGVFINAVMTLSALRILTVAASLSPPGGGAPRRWSYSRGASCYADLLSLFYCPPAPTFLRPRSLWGTPGDLLVLIYVSVGTYPAASRAIVHSRAALCCCPLLLLSTIAGTCSSSGSNC